MERLQNESFEAYKVRRAAMNKLTRLINYKTKGQMGLQSSRKQMRDAQKDNENYHGGTYGVNILAKFARDRVADGVLPAKHMNYLADKTAQKKARKDFNKMHEQLKAA